jgi:hypothetical protein
MSDKTELWDRLGKTDPAHTKNFKRAGGFSGTAIKPMWSYRRMTEEFGPCGVGWGVNEPLFQVVHSSDEALVYCTVGVWHGNRDNVVFGVGGDKAVGKNKFGAFTDDEAFKKAFTDATTNALKMIGVGADVHMGLFDDNKYVNELREEFRAADPVDPVVDQAEIVYQRFVMDTRDIIEAFEDDHDGRLRWWNADAQKQARRDVGLRPADLITLKNLITSKAQRTA